MNFGEIIGIVGSFASIISIVGAVFSYINSKKAKKYSEIYYTTDTKEKLQTVFVRLESIQDITNKLNHSDKRGIKINIELKEYEEIRQKLDRLINIVPSKYSLIVSRLTDLRGKIDAQIQTDKIIEMQDLVSFKTGVILAIGEVKKELEDLRSDLVDLTTD